MPASQPLDFDDFLAAAVAALNVTPSTARGLANRPLGESALAAPFASFGGVDLYSDIGEQAAVLLQRLCSNHALADGNKRTALLCAILFAGLNGYHWDPPEDDAEDGEETASIVEAAAAGHLPLPALAAWVRERLRPVRQPWTGPQIFAAEYVGELHYDDHAVTIGDVKITDLHGYNPASIYVRRVSGKTDGLSVAEIIISLVGDGYAQEELDLENEEANRYPLGPKEYWRGKMVGKYRSGADGHLLTDEEFEAEWAEET